METPEYCYQGINLVKSIEIQDEKLLSIVNEKVILDIPMSRVKSANGIKNELAVELLQNFDDEKDDNLIEIRYYIH